jgi:hypothetical protein
MPSRSRAAEDAEGKSDGAAFLAQQRRTMAGLRQLSADLPSSSLNLLPLLPSLLGAPSFCAGDEAAKYGVMDGSIVKVHCLAGQPSKLKMATMGLASTSQAAKAGGGKGAKEGGGAEEAEGGAAAAAGSSLLGKRQSREAVPEAGGAAGAAAAAKKIKVEPT